MNFTLDLVSFRFQFGLKSYLRLQEKNDSTAWVLFEIKSMISDQNCTPLNTVTTNFVTSIFFFNGNVKQSFGNKSGKICHTIAFFASLFSCNFICYFKQALKPDWLFCPTVPFSLARKVWFRAENIALQRANQIARITSDF